MNNSIVYSAAEFTTCSILCFSVEYVIEAVQSMPSVLGNKLCNSFVRLYVRFISFTVSLS